LFEGVVVTIAIPAGAGARYSACYNSSWTIYQFRAKVGTSATPGFVVRLARVSLRPSGRPSVSKHRSAMTLKPSQVPLKRILLAEDDDSMRGFLERALVKAGYEVVAFDNGKDALDCLRHETFTLLLTDIVMPLMDGIELARRASEVDPTLRIMFITGFAAVTLNTGQKAPKEAKVLSKPFHLRDLVNEIERVLAAAA
jgi:two-component system cell cycle response regulator CpdR